MNALGRYIMNWLRWWDQGLNVLTGGDSLETLSSRAGKGQREGKKWACILCRFLDLFQPNHCARSINPDDGRNATLSD